VSGRHLQEAARLEALQDLAVGQAVHVGPADARLQLGDDALLPRVDNNSA
jgi:hypothetical protein